MSPSITDAQQSISIGCYQIAICCGYWWFPKRLILFWWPPDLYSSTSIKKFPLWYSQEVTVWTNFTLINPILYTSDLLLSNLRDVQSKPHSFTCNASKFNENDLNCHLFLTKLLVNCEGAYLLFSRQIDTDVCEVSPRHRPNLKFSRFSKSVANPT